MFRSLKSQLFPARHSGESRSLVLDSGFRRNDDVNFIAVVN